MSEKPETYNGWSNFETYRAEFELKSDARAVGTAKRKIRQGCNAVDLGMYLQERYKTEILPAYDAEDMPDVAAINFTEIAKGWQIQHGAGEM